MRSIDGRIADLLREAEDLLRNVAGAEPYYDPTFVAWKNRAEGAVIEKLGERSRQATRMAELTFWYDGPMWEGMDPVDAPAEFRKGMHEAIGILQAALEAEPVARTAPGPNRGTVINIDNSARADANAAATAEVTIDGTAEQLRRLLAEAPGLSRTERAEAIGAVPDDDEPIDLESIDKLLSIATKARSLLIGITGWVVANIDRLPSF